MTEPPRPLPGAAAGFSISLLDAARSLDVTPDSVVDLVRSGCLTACVVAANETVERPPLRFDEVHLTALRASLNSGVTADPSARVVAVIAAVSAGLRDYLTRMIPSDVEQRAVEEGRPLLAQARDGNTYAHVRGQHVAEASTAIAAPGLKVVLNLPTTVPDALRRLGCQEVRGIRPAGDSRQTWKTWWRVPLSIWSLAEEDALRVDDFPALGGMRADDR